MNLATFILISVPLAIKLFADKFREDDRTRMLVELEAEFGVPRIPSFDFIVVGGGSAGSTVAGRLSESGRFSVLLLEAGGNPVPASDVPAFRPQVSEHADADTNNFFTTIPQEGAGDEGGGGGRLTVSAGRMLGGSGSHNGMIYVRGHPHDFDNWARLTGDGGWSYANVLPYFKKAEDFIGVLLEPDEDEYYGKGGPLKIDTYLNPFLPVWLQAGRELGYHIGDPNGLQSESFTSAHMMIHEGRRVSAYNGYVKPFEGVRPNLTLLRYSFVDEVLIDERGNAFGVAYKRHGIQQRAYASKEVIISGGVHQSPLLLMKSGVGPADVLDEAQIPAKAVRAGVGLNLGEHVMIGLTVYVNDSRLLGRIRDGPEGERELEAYHESGSGLLGEPFSGAIAFVVSSRAQSEGQGDWPDIEIQNFLRPNGILPATPEGSPESLLMQVVNTRARQRGSVRLNGTAWREGERDDQRLAVIDLQHLSDPTDIDVLVQGIKLGLRAFENTSAFQEAGAWFSDVPLEQCAEHEFRSDEYWRCLVRWRGTCWNHRSGTCRMGTADDPEAVVDSSLRVIGLQGLRVIDASVMPTAPNGNNCAATIMVAEKGAAEILREYD